jgi:hypothetical protein
MGARKRGHGGSSRTGGEPNDNTAAGPDGASSRSSMLSWTVWLVVAVAAGVVTLMCVADVTTDVTTLLSLLTGAPAPGKSTTSSTPKSDKPRIRKLQDPTPHSVETLSFSFPTRHGALQPVQAFVVHDFLPKTLAETWRDTLVKGDRATLQPTPYLVQPSSHFHVRACQIACVTLELHLLLQRHVQPTDWPTDGSIELAGPFAVPCSLKHHHSRNNSCHDRNTPPRSHALCFYSLHRVGDARQRQHTTRSHSLCFCSPHRVGDARQRDGGLVIWLGLYFEQQRDRTECWRRQRKDSWQPRHS